MREVRNHSMIHKLLPSYEDVFKKWILNKNSSFENLSVKNGQANRKVNIPWTGHREVNVVGCNLEISETSQHLPKYYDAPIMEYKHLLPQKGGWIELEINGQLVPTHD